MRPQQIGLTTLVILVTISLPLPLGLPASFQASQVLAQIPDTRKAEADQLLNSCAKQLKTSQFQAALKSCQQALTIYQGINERTGEADSLNSLGSAYNSIGQYQKAIEYHQQALAIARAIGDRTREAGSLNNLGSAYNSLGQDNLGLAYNSLGQYQKAIEYSQQALAIARATGDRPGEAGSLNNLGRAYYFLGQYQRAIEYNQQALAIARAIGNRSGEGIILSSIGYMSNVQGQPELAVVFYKQSVNVREAIRQDIRGLPREQQESYTETVAGTYRSLANLLLSQGRILEAQQVLELLKVQELRDFTRNARAGGETDGIAVNPVEAEILKKHGTLIAFGQQVDQCKQVRCSQLSQLNDQLQALTQQYNQTVKTFAKDIRDRAAQDTAILDPEDLSRKAKEIVEAQPGTVLVYPFVLEDKTWLLWAASGGVVKSVAVPVKRQQLGETALKFHQLLQNPNSDITEVKATGKQLYDWLIKPLEPELKANKIRNLVFSLDRVTRYLPMSALFDGKQYLVENYTISTVLSADLTDTRDRLPSGTQNTPVLALGLSNAVPGFSSLPNVPAELDAIVRQNSSDKQGIYPGEQFLNSRFDSRTLRDNLLGRQVLHVATHGKFVPGRPEDSFLVLGTGEKLTIPDIQTLPDLGDVHLVVLSACETALGGPDEDGVEISGISYYFLNSGAKAVMASLWLVNDTSTRLSMQQFYSNLANGTAKTSMTKAMSLRQAQLSLLHGKVSKAAVPDRRGIEIVPNPDARPASAPAETNFSHPYYWAPFILIGNSL